MRENPEMCIGSVFFAYLFCFISNLIIRRKMMNRRIYKIVSLIFSIVLCLNFFVFSVSAAVGDRVTLKKNFHGKVLLSVLLMETEQEDLLMPPGNIVTIQWGILGEKQKTEFE